MTPTRSPPPPPAGVVGQAMFNTSGTFTWSAPADVTHVSAVCVGGGGGSGTYVPSLGDDQVDGAGGGGGECRATCLYGTQNEAYRLSPLKAC
jgi:hypothetical protein